MKFTTTFALLAVLLVAASEAFVLRDEPVVIISHDGKITRIPVKQLPECYHKLQPLLDEYLTKEQVTTEQMITCFATTVDISECFDKYNSILYNITQRITVISQEIDVCLLAAIQPAATASTPGYTSKTPRSTTPPTTSHYKPKSTTTPWSTTTPHFSVSPLKPTITPTTTRYFSTTTQPTESTTRRS